jgi:hypothetical protein
MGCCEGKQRGQPRISVESELRQALWKGWSVTAACDQSRLGRMARKLRVQYPGAIYHVMNRGDRRESDLQSRPGSGVVPQGSLRK